MKKRKIYLNKKTKLHGKNTKSIEKPQFSRKTQKIKISVKDDPENSDGYIEWTLKPTFAKVALKVQDMMILKPFLYQQCFQRMQSNQ